MAAPISGCVNDADVFARARVKFADESSRIDAAWESFDLCFETIVVRLFGPGPMVGEGHADSLSWP